MSVRAVTCAALLGLLSAGRVAALESEDRLSFADGLYARGLYDMAIKEYQGCLDAFTNSAQTDVILFRIGESYRGMGNPVAAQRSYQRVLLQFPKSPYRYKAGFREAELLRDGGQSDAAVELLRSFLKENPPADAAATALYMAGDMQQRAGKEEDAAAAFSRVVAEYPASEFYSYALLALGGMYARKDATAAKAMELFAKAAEKPPSERVGAEAWFQLGEFHFRQKDFAKSADAYEKLLTLYPADYRATEARLQAGWAAHNAGLYANALRRCDEVLAGAKPPAGAEAADWLYLKANCERQLLKYEAAVQTYGSLLTQQPDGPLAPAAAYERAVAYFKMGRYRDAAREAKALKLTPDIKKDTYWLLAESHAALHEEDDAIQYYRLVVAEFPNDAIAFDARYRLGNLLQKRGDYAAAVDLFEAVARSAAGNDLAPQSLLASGYCLSQIKKYEEAVRNWGLLIQKYPQSALVESALYQKGLGEIFLHRDEAALASLRDLAKRFPQTKYAPESHYWAGVLLLDAGTLPDAEAEFRAAIAAKPTGDLLNKAQFRLALALQKLGKGDEAAALLQGLLQAPVKGELPPDLLEWMAEYRLEKKDYARAAEAARLIPENSKEPAWTQIGWALTGRAYLGEGRNADAEAAFQKALGAPANTAYGAEAALRLGELAAASTNHLAAVTYFEQAGKMAADDKLLPVRVQSYAGLGRVAKASGHPEIAARYFMSVAVLFDDPELVPECLYEAAQAFKAVGREADRAKAAAELAKRYPDSKWAKMPSP